MPFFPKFQIKLMIDPAIKTLDSLIENGQKNVYDFAFIDADKENYLNYYERCLVLVRKGGLICIDNVLWGGYIKELIEFIFSKNIKFLN